MTVEDAYTPECNEAILRPPPTSRKVGLLDFRTRSHIEIIVSFGLFSGLELNGLDLRFITFSFNLQATTQAYAMDKTEH